jgi:hypothetical protein
MCRLHSHGRNGLEHIIGCLTKRQYLTILCIWVLKHALMGVSDSNLIRIATHFADYIQFVETTHTSQKSASFADAQESRLRAFLVSFSPISSGRTVSDSRIGLAAKSLTRLSNMHLFSGRSTLRQFHSCWLLFSRHSQCLRNSVKQCLFISSILQTLTVSYL